MILFNSIKHFRDDDSGAVTVDWVILTGAIVALSVILLVTALGDVTTISDRISSDVTAAETLANSF